MRFKRLVTLFCAVICVMSMVISVSASARASDQIGHYLIDVMSDNGQIYVDFSVSGTGSMDRVGCESIYIYESAGSRWIEVENFDENDSGMSTRNARRYSNMITADCEIGTRYKVEVTISAEDSAGRDTRSKTFYVTGQA